MNLIQKKEHLSKKTIAIYVIAIVICVLAITIVVSMQVLGNDLINSLFGIQSRELKTEEQENLLKQGFDNLFTNTLEEDLQYDVPKIEQKNDLVYTKYKVQEKNDPNYDLNLYIPYINIEDETIKKYNAEINDIFVAKANSVYQTSNENIIYSIQYKANIENGILSLIIKTILKEGANPQQLVIQTYNYDIINKKEITLEDAINILGADSTAVQNKILTEIQTEERKAEDLKELGYNIFERNSKSDIYKIENSKQFFIYENNLYIIYAYGNDLLTSEMDIVII